MANASRSKPKKQPAKKARPSARSANRKTKSAPARQARKSAPRGRAKAAKRTGKGKSASRPRRAPRTDQVRRQVARPRPGAAAGKLEAQVEHDHQDPRQAGLHGLGAEDSKVQAENYGQAKNRSVARFDKPVNWFRRAPKPPQ